MSEVVVTNHRTLAGVMQAPVLGGGELDETPRRHNLVDKYLLWYLSIQRSRNFDRLTCWP